MTKEEQIKGEVIEASRQLFKNFGYQKTTMEDIARAMKRGKSTLYYYYKSKEEIFETMLVNDANDHFVKIVKNIEKAVSAEEKLKVYILTFYQVINEKVILNDVILNEMLSANNAVASQPTMMENFLRFNERWRLLIKDILIYGVGNKEFNKGVIDDLDAISQVLTISLVSVVMTFACFNNNQTDLRYQASDTLVSLTNILINGLKYRN